MWNNTQGRNKNIHSAWGKADGRPGLEEYTLNSTVDSQFYVYTVGGGGMVINNTEQMCG